MGANGSQAAGTDAQGGSEAPVGAGGVKQPTAKAFANGASTMKAYTIASPSTNLSSIQSTVPVPIPSAGPNEVVIKVVCAGLNPVDWKRTSFPPTEVAYPAILGVDVSGTVVEMGSEVTVEKGHQLGMGMPVHVHLDLRKKYGAFAEYVVCDASVVCRMALNVPFADAAALPCAAWTAYVALFEKLKIESGKTILITGGSGGVGSFAIQFAKYMQLKVITTCSTPNLEFVRSLGADLAVDYTTEDIAEKTMFFTKGECCDYVFETVSATAAIKHAQLLKFSGSICNIVGTLIPEPFFFERQLTLHHVFLGGHHRDEVNRAQLRKVGETVMAMYAAGVIKVPQMELIRWEQVPDALEALKGGHVKGKIVLSMVARKEARKGGAPTPPAEDAQQPNSASPASGANAVQHQPSTMIPKGPGL